MANDTTVLNELVSCSDISENKQRLACFDTLVKKNITEVNSPESINSTVKSVSSAQQVEDFAKEHVKKTDEERAKELTTITLTISSLSKTPYGKWKISFDNGQRWQQKDSTKLKLKVGQRAVLTKGALNAVYLQKENTNKRILVKRLK